MNLIITAILLDYLAKQYFTKITQTMFALFDWDKYEIVFHFNFHDRLDLFDSIWNPFVCTTYHGQMYSREWKIIRIEWQLFDMKKNVFLLLMRFIVNFQ